MILIMNAVVDIPSIYIYKGSDTIATTEFILSFAKNHIYLSLLFNPRDCGILFDLSIWITKNNKFVIKITANTHKK